MQKMFTVEELIVDDSFIRFCNRENEEDVRHWENYLLRFPHEKENIEEAKKFVCSLKGAIQASEKERAIEDFKSLVQARFPASFYDGEENKNSADKFNHTNRKSIYWIWAAASIILVGITWLGITRSKNSDEHIAERTLQGKPQESTPGLLTANGIGKTGSRERRLVYLPDGTKVTLNANSTISVDANFGKNSRLVKLEGEAFFDVTHNEAMPFIVKLQNFDIKVLGTMFNVRSYPGDKKSETALVKGKVEIAVGDQREKRYELKPNEKAVIVNNVTGSGEGEKTAQDRVAAARAAIAIKPITVSSDGNTLVETAWMQNRLEINDETFEELKTKLERWFDVQIVFLDETVKQYRFTATFETETIEQALTAMQLSYSFHYTKSNGIISVGK